MILPYNDCFACPSTVNCYVCRTHLQHFSIYLTEPDNVSVHTTCPVAYRSSRNLG